MPIVSDHINAGATIPQPPRAQTAVRPSPESLIGEWWHSIGSRTVAAGGAHYENPSSSLPDFTLTSEQREVDRHVAEVGWLGYFTSVVSTLGSRVHFRVERLDPVTGQSSPDESGVLQQEWSEFHRPAAAMAPMTRQSWIARDLELLLSIGEFAAWPMMDQGRWSGWGTAHPDTLSRRSTIPGHFGWMLRPDARPGSNGWVDVPYEVAGPDGDSVSTLLRCNIPDRKYPQQASVALARVLPEVRLFRTIVSNLQRSAESRLLMNGLLWIPTTTDDLAGEDDDVQADDVFFEGDGSSATPDGGGLRRLVRDLGTYSRRAWEDPDARHIGKVAPFPFPHHTQPQIVELGRAVDGETLSALAVIIESAARGINTPMDFLTAGVGDSNHWDSAEKRRALNQQSVFPLLDQYQEWFGARFRDYLTWRGYQNIGDVVIGRDATAITIREDNLGQILELDERVGLKRERVAEAGGMNPEDLADLETLTDAEREQRHSSRRRDRTQETFGVTDPAQRAATARQTLR